MSPRLLAHVVAAPAVVAPLAGCCGDDGTTTVTVTTTDSRGRRSRVVTETSALTGVEPRSFRAHFEKLTTDHCEAEGGHGWTQL
jgi:hypothetical protein